MRTRLRRLRSSERGSMAVEVVLLVPVLVMVMLLVVAFGKYVDREADVEAIARDAARAATLERTHGEAIQAANAVVSTAESRLYDGASCAGASVSNNFTAGATVAVTVTCDLPWNGIIPGMNGTYEMTRTAQSPLDQWRRTG